MSILKDSPMLASIVGCLFLLMAAYQWSIRHDSNRLLKLALLVITGFTWIGYTFYEYQMQEWEKTVTNPIRVDLLFVYSLLLALAAVGAVVSILTLLGAVRHGK